MVPIATIWEEFLTIIKAEAGSHVVDTWFKAVSLRRWDPSAQELFLEVPNLFVKEWIRAHYFSLITIHMARLLSTDKIKVHMVLAGEIERNPIIHPTPIEPVAPQESEPIHQSAGRVVQSSSHKPRSIYSHHTFDTFVVGPNNSLAYAAAQAVAEKPGDLYNPLFLYGGSGLGKTHLLHAIGNALKQRYEKITILYQTADRFVNEFINAIRFNKVHIFKEKYRAVDVLLIDDIQFIAHKDQTQEAFFHVFNTLYDLRKQIVFSSDVIPQNIDGLADRLKSRLGWGLVVDVQAPSLETKIAILKKKAELSHEDLPDAIAYFIASLDVANIRELEGLLVRVMAFAALTKQPLSLEIAKKVLAKFHEPRDQVVDFDHVVSAVTRHYNYTLSQLRSKQRGKELSSVRHVAMFLMKKMTDRSLREIGVFLGGRDHSTVMHALTKIEDQRKIDAHLHKQLHQLEQDIIASMSRP